MNAPAPAVPVGAGRWTRVVRNLGLLAAGKVAADGFTFLLFVIVSRRWGAEGLGLYSLAMAATGFVLVAAEFGLTALTVRELGRGRPFRETFGRLLALRLLLCAVTALAAGALLAWLPLPQGTRVAFLLVGAYHVVLPLVDGFSAVFVARERPHGAALLQLSLRAGIALSVIAIAWSGGGLLLALGALPVVTALHAIAGWCWTVRSFGRPAFDFSTAALGGMLREARAFALSDLLFHVQARADVLVLGLLVGVAAAGSYNAAYRIAHLWMLLAHVSSLSLLPLAARLYPSSPVELRSSFASALGGAVRLGLPAAAGCALVAPALVRAVYGDGFGEAALVLRLLAPLLLLAAVRIVLSVFLVACDRQHEQCAAQGQVALLSLVGNLTLVPLWGIVGAAAAALVSETVFVGLLARRIRGALGEFPLPRPIWPSVLATAAFTLPLAVYSIASLPLAIFVAVAIHGCVLLLFPHSRAVVGRGLSAVGGSFVGLRLPGSGAARLRAGRSG